MGIFGQYIIKKMFEPSAEELAAKEAARVERIDSLFGEQAGQYQLSEDEYFGDGTDPIHQFTSGYETEGSGLLGAMDDPKRIAAAKFAQGLMTDPTEYNQSIGSDVISNLVKEMYKQPAQRTPHKRTMTTYGVGDGMKQSGYFDADGNFIKMGVPTKSSGVEIKMPGETKSRVEYGTKEDNIRWGYPPELPTFWNDKSGKLEPTQKMTEMTAKNMQVADMMQDSEDRFSALKSDFPDFDPAGYIDASIRSLETGGGFIGNVAGKFQSDASKAFSAMSKQWISANRSGLSGAAVPEQEVARDLATYFPQAGDPEWLIETKERMRKARQKSVEQTIGLGLSEAETNKRLRASADADSMMVQKQIKQRMQQQQKTIEAMKPSTRAFFNKLSRKQQEEMLALPQEDWGEYAQFITETQGKGLK